MSKPIKLTDDLLKKIQEEFIANVKSMKMFDGKINYAKNFKWEDDGNDKAVVTFSPVAFAKMTAVIQQFDSEVAWHGVAFRDDQQANKFYISDILVYPQLVSGSTVNTDQDKYQEWLYTHDDEVFNNIRMQGHSHVNFSTTPSGVDATHQEKILSQLDDDMFYIFMIWNKKFERTIKIYDMLNNTLYENSDVIVRLGENGVDLDAFIKEAKELVKAKYQYGTYVGQDQKIHVVGAPGSTPAASPSVRTPPALPDKKNEDQKQKKKEKKKSVIGMGWQGANAAYGSDDEYDPYSYMEQYQM